MNYPAAELRGIKVLELIAITYHSELDPESSPSTSSGCMVSSEPCRRVEPWIPAFAGMTTNTDYTPKQSFEEFFD